MQNGMYPQTNQNNSRKKLIIALIAMILVLAIAAGGIVFIFIKRSGTDKDVEKAEESYLPPAETVQIDTTKDDPSNDQIQFTYDDRDRVTSCTYSVNGYTYDQAYTYDDDAQKIDIETSYKKHPICTKEIEYCLVIKVDIFVCVEGYYIRLDQKSLEGILSTESPTAASTEKPADPVPEKPTEAPKATEKPAEPTDPPQEEIPTIRMNDTLTLSGTISTEEDYVNEMNHRMVTILNLDEPFECYLYDGTFFDGETKYTIDSVQLGDNSAEVGDHVTVTGEVTLAHTQHHLRKIVLCDCVYE